ncbi:MAG: hypothetical protein LBP53_02150, partial [Candidatus Peribacteria bacterium]|nr:hypothetical protein [Candidatus Peribacteria bacterium]
QAKSDSDWAGVLSVLLNVGFLTEDEKKAYTPKYLELLDTATEEAKSDSHWAGVLSAVLDRGLLTEEDKPKYLKLLDTVTEEAKSGSSWAKYVLPVLLNVGFLTEEEKKAYTPKYLELLDTVTEKAKSDSTWANYVLPAVLDRGLLTQEDKPKYLELLDTVTEEAKSNSNWARYVLPAVLDRGLLTQEDKPKYLELLDTVTEEAKSNSDWANYVLPALLKLNFLSFISTSSLSSQQQQIFSALQHYNDSRSLSWLAVMPPQISLSDIALLTSFCSPVEKKYLVAQHFEGVEALLAALHTQNYPEIRKFKAASYSDDEKTKLQELQIYFGEEIRTYFFDKVHTTRPLSERFRAPHDALEHYEKIISFAQELETFTPPLPKETLFKTLLAKIPNSNAGYQEFNTFLRSYQP